MIASRSSAPFTGGADRGQRRIDARSSRTAKTRLSSPALPARTGPPSRCARGMSPPIIKEQIRRALAKRRRQIVANPRLRRAAVLVPVYEDGDGLQVLFTKRSEELPHHKGQIAFPGGTQQPEDQNPHATALRESEEEVGLKPGDVEVLGELDDTVTATSNFVVTPFVGFIPYPYSFRVNPAEIVELIPIPLSLLCDPSRFREELWDRDGGKTPGYYYTVGSHVIWGLTARILKQFLEAVFPASKAAAWS